MDEKLVPKRRFVGFTGDWEQHKFGDLANIVRGASPRPIQDPKWFDSSSDIGWLRIADVTEQNGRIKHLEQHISLAGQKKTRVLTEEHLLLSIAATVGKPVINYVKTGAHDGFLIFQNPTFNREFMFQWLEMYRPQWQKYGQPGSQVNLNSDLVKNQRVILPCKKEQKKIGEFFANFDNLIASQQQKLDKTKAMKSAYLSEMFPADGESKPKRRFAGFTDDWEQHELGNIATMKARIGWQGLTKKEFLEEGEYYLITGTDFKNGKVDFNNISFIAEDRYKQDVNIQITNDDVLITKDGTIGKVAYVDSLDKPATLNAGVFVIRGKSTNISNLYLYHYLAAPYLLQYADKQATGGTIKHLNQNVLVSFPIPIPQVMEQKKIGEFFTSLDNLIASQQQKLDKLKDIKKAYLNEMFI